ncbi:hypothetical protein HC752_23615 [Vibrio sp. S9_S30]|uniref:hypothetical protein n=1 Tax=Vibrio sp. S9_S30 TaxID=2720226 RepID=UPI001680A4CE|nr:hypothetical protein [Vibrio sp. S9_S30]MBD1559916.1 hypothetical protein [Vibrio sp. S9_S30]
MKFFILLPIVLLLSACISPNTKDEFFSKGNATPEISISAPLNEVEGAVDSYISKCFANTETIVNGVSSLALFSVEKVEHPDEKGVWVKQWINGGYFHLVYFKLSVNSHGKGVLSAIERPKLGTIYDELEVMAKGDVPNCELI